MSEPILRTPTRNLASLVLVCLGVMTSHGADVPLKLSLRDLSQPQVQVPGGRAARLPAGLLVEASQTKRILKGDVIVRINDQPIPNMHAYQQWLASAKGGQVHDFTMYRRTKLGYYQREMVRVIVPRGKTTTDSIVRSISNKEPSVGKEETWDESSPAILAYLAEQSRRQRLTNDPRTLRVKFDEEQGYLPMVGRIGFAGNVDYYGELEGGKVLVKVAGTDLVMPSLADALHGPFLVGPAERYTTAAGTSGTALTAQPLDLDAILEKQE